MTNHRVRTVLLYNDADYCGHVDPDANYDQEPYASMPEEQLDDLIGEYQDNHIGSDDIYVCLLSPAGVGLEEWIPPYYVGTRLAGHGYWSIIEDRIIYKLERQR